MWANMIVERACRIRHAVEHSESAPLPVGEGRSMSLNVRQTETITDEPCPNRP
ncbi:hypothetical protein DEU38_11585 [Rhodococcus sp. AG1013]|nr:hypothetical protein DEU38_11585 [Rhodococcus sp. AG1013]